MAGTHLTRRRAATRILEGTARYPIIAGVRNLEHLSAAIVGSVDVVFLMTGDIFTLPDAVEKCRHAGKACAVHVDFVKGIAPDREGIRFVARTGADAVVSTRIHLLQIARSARLGVVLHMLAIDTQALETSVRHAEEIQPDAVELMPGLMPRVISDLRGRIETPILAAGLIQTFAEAQAALDAGAVGAVTGNPELWSVETSAMP